MFRRRGRRLSRNEEVAPPRDEDGARRKKIDSALIKKFFEMGLMGIEVAEEYGGRRWNRVFMIALGVEELSKVDPPPAAILMDVAEHARQLPDPQLRQRPHQVDVPTAAHWREGRRVRAGPREAQAPMRSACRPRAEQRGDRWILNGRKMWITNGAEAQVLRRLCPTRIRQRATRALRHSSSSAASRGFSVGKKEDKLGISRVEYDGAHPRRRRSAGGKTCSVPWGRVTRSRSKR